MYVDYSEYMRYCANPRVPNQIRPTALASPTTTSQTAAFQRGNKRDLAQYPVLKDILNFSTWRLSFEAIAIKDGLENILDPSYIPAPVGESETMFQYQQQFLFAVFTQTLKDPTAKDILSKHRRHGDA